MLASLFSIKSVMVPPVSTQFERNFRRIVRNLTEYIPMRHKQKKFLPSYLRYSIECYVLLAFIEKFNHFGLYTRPYISSLYPSILTL
jgi:hypothetical protein